MFSVLNSIIFLDRICAEMAELSTSAREYEKAINFYKEGLTYDDTHLPVSVHFSEVEKSICPSNASLLQGVIYCSVFS